MASSGHSPLGNNINGFQNVSEFSFDHTSYIANLYPVLLSTLITPSISKVSLGQSLITPFFYSRCTRNAMHLLQLVRTLDLWELITEIIKLRFLTKSSFTGLSVRPSWESSPEEVSESCSGAAPQKRVGKTHTAAARSPLLLV